MEMNSEKGGSFFFFSLLLGAYSLQDRHSNDRDRWTTGWCRRGTEQRMGRRKAAAAAALGLDLRIQELMLHTCHGQIVEDTFLLVMAFSLLLFLFKK